MKSLFLKIAIVLVLLATSRGADLGELRGERVGWARLKSPSEYWRRHATGDPTLMQFLRDNSSLNIDPAWYVADCERLDQMCAYPLLFSQGVQSIESAKAKANVAEYLRRGGFLLIDACCNRDINPSDDLFLQQQIRFLAEAVPEARVVALPPNHEIYRCYFQIPGGKPPHTFFNNVFDPDREKHGLYAIRMGRRMAGIITLSGLQCGWDHMIAPPGNDVACMKMLVNIYIYSMLQP